MEQNNKPGLDEKSFYISFGIDPFEKNDVLSNGSHSMKVISKPRRKWYSLLFQYLTLGLHRASWRYKLERMDDGN